MSLPFILEWPHWTVCHRWLGSAAAKRMVSCCSRVRVCVCVGGWAVFSPHKGSSATRSVLVNSSSSQEHIYPDFCHRSHCLCKSAGGAARPLTPPVFCMCFLKFALWSLGAWNLSCRTWRLKGQVGISSSWSQSSPCQLLIYSYSYPFCVLLSFPAACPIWQQPYHMAVCNLLIRPIQLCKSKIPSKSPLTSISSKLTMTSWGFFSVCWIKISPGETMKSNLTKPKFPGYENTYFLVVHGEQ